MAETILVGGDHRANRLLILSLAGFSYSGLLALALLSTITGINLDLSAYYLLVSFLSYYLALNLQSYRYRRWHDHLGNALLDSGGLSLILSALSVILSSHFSRSYKIWTSVSAFMVWYLDHILRLWIVARRLGSTAHAEEPARVRHMRRASRRRSKRSIIGDTLWYVVKGYKSE
jgi:hypothetical protein